jgi:putative tryptophan/tyrosine transport system substrate-binding protein
LSLSLALAAVGWIAFISPDFPQSRSLFAEYQARMAPVLKARDLEARFIPIADTLEAPMDGTVTQVLAARPVLVVAPALHVAAAVQRMAKGSTPVIFSSRVDPVRAGLADSLARPGRNATGISYDVGINYKQLELLKQLAPRVRTVGVLADDIWLHEETGAEKIEAYERSIGVKLVVLVAKSAAEMPGLVESDQASAVDAWLVPITNFSGRMRNEVVAAIRASRKPAVYGRSFFADAGGLAAYQEVFARPIEVLAEMSMQVLRGTPAGDIPVRRPRDFELVLNQDEAHSLGITFPTSLLRRAHRIVGAPPSP